MTMPCTIDEVTKGTVIDFNPEEAFRIVVGLKDISLVSKYPEVPAMFAIAQPWNVWNHCVTLF